MDGAIWVDAFKVGDLVAHPKYGEQRYTEPQLREAIKNFQRLKAQGYTTDVLREHGTQDSYVYGTIHDLRIDESGYFQALTEFFRKQDREAYNEGILRQFSPGFAHEWLDPHTGEVLANVLIELSFTSRAYQRNLRPPQQVNPGVVLSDSTPLHLTPSGVDSITPQAKEVDVEPEEKAPEEAEEMMAPEEEKEEFCMEKAFAGLSAQLSALMDMMKPEEMAAPEEDVAMSDEVSEVERLSAENAELRAELVRLDLVSKGIDNDRASELVKLSAKLDADEFAKVVEYSTPGVVVQEEIGSTGIGETDTKESIADIVANAPMQYGADGRFTLWANREYPDLASEIIKHARASA